MGFHESAKFPEDISYGSLGGPGYDVSIVVTDSGQEERVAKWASARRRYNVAYGVKTWTQMKTLLTFYVSRSGAAYGFRYKDFMDYSTDPDATPNASTPAHDDVQLGSGDASTTQFQLIKKYTSGGVTKTRNLKKIVADTTKVGLDGVNQTSGWSVNTASGIVTFSSAPGSGVIVSAGCEFDVPVRFSEELDALMLNLETFETGGIDRIPLIEIIDDDEIADECYYGGGASYESLTADLSLIPIMGRALRVKTTTPGLSLLLPSPTNYPAGGPYFYLYNTGTEAFTIKDHNGSSIGTLIASEVKEVFIYIISGTTKGWNAF